MSRRFGTPAQRGLAEELLYEELLSVPSATSPSPPALMVLKNGALMTGFWYEGPDLEAASQHEVGRVCAAVHRALEVLGQVGGWVVHFECIRRKERGYLTAASGAAAVDLVCDEEREARAEYYETRHAMFLTFLEAREEASFLGRLERFVRGEIGGAEVLGRPADGSAEAASASLLQAVRLFEHRVEQIEGVLKGAGIAVERMRTTRENCALLQALNYVCNGVWHPVRPPPRGAHLDVLLAQDLRVELDERGVVARHGGRAYQIVEPIRFPEESWANMLRTLEQLDVEWRRSTRAIFVGTSEAVAQLEDKEKKWDGLRHHLKDVGKLVKRPRQAAVEAADEVGQALRDIENGKRFGVHVTNVVVVTGDTMDAVREAAREVERAFQLSGFVAHVQKKNNRQALLGSFPGHGHYNVRRPFIDSLNLVHFLALSTEWEGEATVPSKLYPRGSPALLQARSLSKARFFVNLHQAPGGAARPEAGRCEDAAHAAMFGPVGSGKNALANAVASQFLARYANARVVYLDNGYNAYKLAKSRGQDGVHYALGAEGAQLHPFARIWESRWEKFANDFVAGLAQRQGAHYGPQERIVIADALQRLKHGRRPEDRSLRRLWMDINEPRALKLVLEHFVLGGGKGVIDGEQDLLSAARFTCFELGELIRRDASVAQAGLHYMLEWIRTVPDGAPMLLVLDEAGLALRDRQIAERIMEFVLRGRKENVHLLLLFHSPKQLLESPLASEVITNVQTRFWLPNPQVQSRAGQEGYRELGASDEVLALIGAAQRRQQYVYHSGQYARVFSLELGPVQRAFWTQLGDDDLGFVRRLEGECGERWPREYLERLGQIEAARRWERLTMKASSARGAA
jgi:hypothetical protein